MQQELTLPSISSLPGASVLSGQGGLSSLTGGLTNLPANLLQGSSALTRNLPLDPSSVLQGGIPDPGAIVGFSYMNGKFL